MKDVIITSGDIKKDYEILGLIYCETKASHWEFGFEDSVEELKEKCLGIGGNAIIYLRQNTVSDYLRFYGTAVKIKD